MKKTFTAVTGIMLALMMLFVSCEQGGMSKSQIDSRDLVSVSFTKVEAKSVNVDSIGEVTTPALNTLYFQYKAVKTAGEGAENVQGQKTEWTNLGSQGLSQTIQLSRGNWTISLRGFATDALRTAAGNSETASTRAVFEGSLSQDIGSDLTSRNENVNVSLDFTNPAGTGSYSLAVSIPASYASQQAKVKVTITPASGDAQVQTYQFAEGTSTYTYSFSTVNNGIASVKVEYLDASDAAIGDAVTANTLIMTDMTTNGSASIAEDNTFTVSFAGTTVNGNAEDSTIVIEKPILSCTESESVEIKAIQNTPNIGNVYVDITNRQDGVTYYYTLNTSEYTIASSEPVDPSNSDNIFPEVALTVGSSSARMRTGAYLKVIGYKDGKYSEIAQCIVSPIDNTGASN